MAQSGVVAPPRPSPQCHAGSHQTSTHRIDAEPKLFIDCFE